MSRRPLTQGEHAARVTVSAPLAEVERARGLARAAGFATMSAWTRHLWAAERDHSAQDEIETHAPDPRQQVSRK